MVQRYLNRPVLVAALAAVVVGSLIPFSKVGAQGTTNIAARKKAEEYVQKNFSLPKEATIKFVDLNGDGIPEALVISSGPQDCGSHGCGANVLDLRGPAAKDIGDFIAVDLQPLSTRTQGWRDISIVGQQNNARLRFNGQVYSSSSSSAADLQAPTAVASPTAPRPGTPPPATGWASTSFSNPSRMVGYSPTSGKAKVWLICQGNPRSAELRIDPGTSDPDAQEDKKSRFLIEIQNASGRVQTFPLAAHNFGPDGGSQFYSRDFLSAPFLAAFAQEGGVLRWRTDKGAELASWHLIGTAAVREMVRKICNL